MQLINFFFVFSGWGVLAGVWIFTLRSVRYLVLRKGSNTISFATYNPLGNRPKVSTYHLNEVM